MFYDCTHFDDNFLTKPPVGSDFKSEIQIQQNNSAPDGSGFTFLIP